MRFVDGAWVVAGVVNFECGWPCFMSFAETLIPATLIEIDLMTVTVPGRLPTAPCLDVPLAA